MFAIPFVGPGRRTVSDPWPHMLCGRGYGVSYAEQKVAAAVFYKVAL